MNKRFHTRVLLLAVLLVLLALLTDIGTAVADSPIEACLKCIGDCHQAADCVAQCQAGVCKVDSAVHNGRLK